MQNGRGKIVVINGKLTISAENIGFEQYQTTRKSSAPFQPFFDKFVKNSGLNWLFRALLCFAAEILAPWQH
jgi:hypothetical protein